MRPATPNYDRNRAEARSPAGRAARRGSYADDVARLRVLLPRLAGEDRKRAEAICTQFAAMRALSTKQRRHLAVLLERATRAKETNA